MMSDRVGNEFITTCEGRLGVAFDGIGRRERIIIRI